MKQRLQVSGSGLRIPSLRPTASPVDTFAPSQAGQQLQQLARSLAEFAPGLARFGDALYEKESKEALAEGSQEARKLIEQRKTLKEAVAKGLIPAHRNPFFLVGLKEQFGRIAAGNYATSLKEALDADEGMQSSTDLADFESFESEFRKKWLDSEIGDNNRDLHFERGFGNLVDGYTLDVRRQFGAAVGQRIQKQAGQQVYTESLQILKDHATEDPKMRVQMIEGMVRNFLTDNPKGGRMANLAVIRAVADFARLTEDEEVLDLMEQIGAGPGSKLAGLPEASDALLDARKDIWQRKEARLSMANRAEERQQEKAEDAFWTEFSSVVDSAITNGTADSLDIEPFVQRMRAIDPANTARAEKIVRDYVQSRKEGKANDGHVYKAALLRVYGLDESKPGFLSIREAGRLLAGSQIDAPQFNNLVNQIQERDREGRGQDGVASLLSDRTFTFYLSSLTSRFIDEYGVNESTVRNMAANAKGEFLNRYLQWKVRNPDATPKEKQEALAQMEQDVFFDMADPDVEEGFFQAQDARTQRSDSTAAAPNGGPTPKKAEVALYSRADFQEIERDALAWIADRRVQMSDRVRRALFNAKVAPTPEAVQKWLDEQRKLPPPR